MNARHVFALVTAAAAAVSLSACGAGTQTEATGSNAAAETSKGLSYTELTLGEDYTDLSAGITVFNNRTDMAAEDYRGTTWAEYVAAFNRDYPNISVEIITDTNYAEDALTHLQSGDYETVMLIPAVDKADLSTYFMSYGDLDTVKTQVNFADKWVYENQVYGVPATAITQGVVYNKAVFAAAGIRELPTTPDTFLEALQKIKDNTDAIPLYTNYAAGWTMGQWDGCITGSAGDAEYKNIKLSHTKDPFQNYGDDSHPYALYKILYDAVAAGLTEEDYSTTDWEGSKSMLNNGEIGCMVLGSWAYPQMEAAGEHAEDIGYMPFPITVEGTQYASAGPDYCYGINANASEDEKIAGLVFVKWMTEKSGFTYNEAGLPVAAGSTETKLDFSEVVLLQDTAALSGEEDILGTLNADTELNIDNGGDRKLQEVIEHASKGDKSFDEIMQEWNDAWTAAQEQNDVEIRY